MKTKTTFCALALLAMLFAVQASAEARNYRPHATTVQKLADTAEVIVVAQLDRVENVQLTEVGLDAAKHKRINDGAWQDGEDYVRREAVLSVNSVIKGDSSLAGAEFRFVSMRQLKLAAYDTDLRNGEAVYFLARREDGRHIVLSDERGTLSPGEASAGELSAPVAFIKDHVANGSNNTAGITRMLDAILLDGSRLSVDCAMELSWHHESYAPAMNAEQRQRILDLCKLSQPGSAERVQLITAAGRHPAEGALEGLLEVMLGDTSWTTTSLASMSLEYVDRGAAIVRLLAEYELATDNTVKMVIIRSLGLIRPKADHDGAALRNDTLQIVNELLVAGTDGDLLREALIASRDLRSGSAHIENLKSLIDNRETNGLADAEVKAAVIALCAARTDGEAIEKDYLKELADSDPLLKQVVASAGKFPYTTLILGADGKGH